MLQQENAFIEVVFAPATVPPKLHVVMIWQPDSMAA